MICSNFTTFAVESPIAQEPQGTSIGCDLLKFHYLCGRITNKFETLTSNTDVVICSNFTTFAVESPIIIERRKMKARCDLLKFHYLCGRITNLFAFRNSSVRVLICSNFTTFAVESPIAEAHALSDAPL